MNHLGAGLYVVIALVASVPPADALVLCANASGSVAALDVCKAGQTQLDPAAVGLVGPAGPQGKAGPTGPRGPSNGFVGDNFSAGFVAIPVNADAAAPTRVLALALPAGSYILQSTVGLQADIAAGTLAPYVNVQCSFADGDGPFGATSRTLVGGSTDSSASIPLLATLTLTAAETVIVECFKNSDAIAVSTRASTVTALQIETLAGP